HAQPDGSVRRRADAEIRPAGGQGRARQGPRPRQVRCLEVLPERLREGCGQAQPVARGTAMLQKIGDLDVHYEVQGSGPPMVLLHGGGSRAQTFEEMAPILAASFRVYTPDMRGFGDTRRPPEPKLSHELWSTDLLRFLDALGLD